MDTAGIAGKGVSKDIEIADGCWLGAGSIILPGVKVGYKSVIAAGAVVTKDIDPYTMVAAFPQE
jgi:acetyltransferase-like isoleucine patch superfamily enzyme